MLTTTLVRSVIANFCRSGRFLLVLTIPENTDRNRARVIWTHEISAEKAQKTVINLPSDKQFTLNALLRVGYLATDGGEVPLVSTARFTSKLQRSAEALTGLGPGTIVTFDSLNWPYTFDLQFCSDEDCPKSGISLNTSPAPASQSNTKASVSAQTSSQPARRCRSRAALGQADGRSILQVVHGDRSEFTATHLRVGSCASDVTMYVQLWRPVATFHATHQLIWSKKIVQGQFGAGTVELTPEERIYVEPHYRIGVYVENRDSEIPVVVDFSLAEKLVFARTQSTGNLCNVQQFLNLKYPMRLSLTFCPNKECDFESADRSKRGSRPESCTLPTTPVPQNGGNTGGQGQTNQGRTDQTGGGNTGQGATNPVITRRTLEKSIEVVRSLLNNASHLMCSTVLMVVCALASTHL